MLNKSIRHKRLILFMMVFFFFSSFLLVLTPYQSEAINQSFGEYNYQSATLNRNQESWNTVRNSASASNVWFNQSYQWASARRYGGDSIVNRVVSMFDTTSISSDSTINNASFRIYHNPDTGIDRGMVYIVGGDFGTTPDADDYNIANLTYFFGSFNYTNAGNGWVTCNISENLSYLVNKSGITSIMLISEFDYLNLSYTTDSVGQRFGESANVFLIYLDLDYSYTGEEYETPYCYIGDLTNENINFKGFSMGHERTFHEGRYNKPFDGTIRQVDLILSSIIYNRYPLASNYRMRLNGETYIASVIAPFYMEINGIPSTQYLISWNSLDININAKNLRFAFGIYSGGEYQNFQYLAKSPNDLNNDGENQRRWHTQINLFINNMYDGSLTYSSEIAYRFWHDCEEADPDDLEYDFEVDTVFVSPAINGSMEFNTGDTISYMVYSQDMTSQSYIYINKDESNVDIITMIGELYYGYYTVENAGSWNITLVRASIWRAGVNFTVYDLGLNNYIYTNPQTTLPYQIYYVKYKYTHTEAYAGRIILSTSNDFDDESKYIKDYNVVNGSIGSLPESHISEGIYYWYLCVVYPNNNTYIIYSHIHYCYNQRDNYLTIFKDTVNLYFEYETNYQHFWYGHNYPNWEVILKLNGIIRYNIGGRVEGDIVHYHYTAGSINATMELLTNDGYIILKYQYYIVTGSTEVVTQKDTEYPALINMYFNQDQQILFGIGIIIIALVCPLWIKKQFDIKNMPAIIIPIFGILGFAIGIWLQLFDIYTIIIFGFIFTSVRVWYLLGMGVFQGIIGTQYDEAETGENAKSRQRIIIKLPKKDNNKAKRK